jgi:hypothetical protein
MLLRNTTPPFQISCRSFGQIWSRYACISKRISVCRFAASGFMYWRFIVKSSNMVNGAMVICWYDLFGCIHGPVYHNIKGVMLQCIIFSHPQLWTCTKSVQQGLNRICWIQRNAEVTSHSLLGSCGYSNLKVNERYRSWLTNQWVECNILVHA